MQSIAQKLSVEDISSIMVERIKSLLKKFVKKFIIKRSESALSAKTEIKGVLRGGKYDKDVGTVKIFLIVPKIDVDTSVTVRIDWTKKMHGFWWTKTVVLDSAVDDPETGFGKIHAVVFDMNLSAKNVLRTELLNRKYQKIRKKKGEEKAVKFLGVK